MRKLVLHVKRLFSKFWLYIFFMFAMSPLIGLANLLIMITISLLFFEDPLEPINMDEVVNAFTEEELVIINGEKMDGNVTDEDYFRLLVRYQCFICPRRIDSATIWNGAELTKDAYIYLYEVNDHYRWFNKAFEEGLKERVLSKTDAKGVHTQRLIHSNRNLIYRYYLRHDGGYKEIVITPEELKEINK